MNPSLLLQLVSNSEPPELGPGPRAGARSLADLNRQFDELPAASNHHASNAELIRAALLLWHDHHDAAHTIVQDIETRDANYIHAILHRREPDYGNAKYWFHRVGRHSCFGMLAGRATALLNAKGETSLARQLMPDGRWDPLAFVDACEEAGRKPDSTARLSLLREVQQIEFEVLFDYLTGQEAMT